MPHRVPWDPEFAAGHPDIDAQHQGLLAQCNLLADLCAGAGDDDADRQFDQAFEQIKTLARAHFETELSLLAGLEYPDLEDHRHECDEFEYLAGEIATTENFDRLELQRFLALWCLGHVKGSAQNLRDAQAGGETPA